MKAEIKSVAVGVPKQIRENAWFIENHPEVWARMERRTLDRVFNAEQGTQATAAFDRAMAPYLSDPFRGTKQRRVLSPGTSQIDACAQTARRALEAASLAVEDIDLILVAAFPTAHQSVGDGAFLARALGARAPAWNLESTCSGALAALQMAGALVDAGQARRVLVVVSCMYSRASDWTDTLTWFLGDGCAALVVGECAEGEGFLGFSSTNTAATCGAFRYDLELDERGAPVQRIRAGAEGGMALRDMTPRAIESVSRAALKRAGVALEDVGVFVPNTPLAWFAQMYADVLGVPRERVSSTYDEYANVGPALNPINLHRALAGGRAPPGSTALLFSIGSVSSAAALVTKIGHAVAAPLLEID